MGKMIGLTYDLKSDWPHQPDDPVDASAEFDGEQTIREISGALEAGGHQIKRIGNVRNLLSQIHDLNVDIVFNICEGLRGRNREAQVPLILEMFGVPYIGSDALTMGLTLDKVAAKKSFVADGIPTARFFKAGLNDDLRQLNTIGFPLIVKTIHEGTSKGLTLKSRVENFDQLKKQVEIINTQYRQPALVEEFIRGTEFTVAVMGNNPPQPMPVVQYSMAGSTDLGDHFYTFDHVVKKSVEYICPAPIAPELAQKMQDLAVKVYQSVDCRDFGRVDFRVDRKGNPFVLEINPLPNLSREEVFALFSKVIGSTYHETINRIVDIALERYGMVNKEETLRR